jgi:fatty-acyl-CoA synthase
VVDIHTREPLPSKKSGIVYLRGPYVMEGYYKKPEETKEAIDPDGWLSTGDLAMIDENGNFRITGRHKDLIMPGGENVSPAEVENIIFEHPTVQDVQVIGVPDERLGEVVMAYIILKQGRRCTEQEIINFCKPRMANFKVPKYVSFVTEFPMTPTGKIQKFRLREKALKELPLGSHD